MKDDGLIILRNDESFWGLESTLKVKTRRFFFCKFRDFEVVELSWVTYPEKIKKVFWDGLIVMGDLPGWKMQRFFRDFFKMVKNTEIFQSGLVVMGDLPRWKTQRFFKEVKNTNIFQSGEKCEDFSKWFHCNGQPAQMEDEKSFQRGLTVMGDLPMWKKWNVLKERHDRTQRHIIQETGARMSVWKEIGLEGERGLKSTFRRR